jgi:Zn-dependent membrane protease YugP
MSTLGFIIFDPMYLLFVMLPGMAIGLWAQSKVKSAYAKAAKIRPATGMSGAEAAREIMSAAGLPNFKIERVKGWLSDHYDPRTKTLRLSPDVHDGRSLAALGIAAHEAGHALQDAEGYKPLVARSALVPLAGIGSQLSFIVLIIGLIISSFGLTLVGVLLFSLVVLFQLVTLPVEFDASKRARKLLLSMSMVTQQEDGTVAKVLNAAALTYVAALIASVLQLAYFIMMALSARD